MLRELDFSKHSIADFRYGLKEMFFEEVTQRSRRIVKELLEESVAREFQGYIGVSRYERREARQDYRNGRRTRHLMTTWGFIEDIRVPRSRSNGFQPGAFERYKRVHRAVGATRGF